MKNIYKFKPINNSLRHKKNIKNNLFSFSLNMLKNLRIGYKDSCGRSKNTGHITVRHKGGGTKRKYNKLHSHNKYSISILLGTMYDSKRTAFISLYFDFITNAFYFSHAISKLFVGSVILCKTNILECKLGYRLNLKTIRLGTLINNISHNYTYKILYIKAAGTFGVFLQKANKKCKIKLPSGKIFTCDIGSFASIGVIDNKMHNNVILGKAGANRLKGIRPSVRGIAMNPVDHPHGGRSNGGMVSMTPWGKITRGQKTKK